MTREQLPEERKDRLVGNEQLPDRLYQERNRPSPVRCTAVVVAITVAVTIAAVTVAVAFMGANEELPKVL